MAKRSSVYSFEPQPAAVYLTGPHACWTYDCFGRVYEEPVWFVSAVDDEGMAIPFRTMQYPSKAMAEEVAIETADRVGGVPIVRELTGGTEPCE